MRYCGRDFSTQEIEWIHQLIKSDSGINRQKLSYRFCEAFNWRKLDGGLKDMSCRVAFIRMDKDGLIRLPPPRRAYVKPGSRIKKTYLPANFPVITEAAGKLDLQLDLVQKRDSQLWNTLIDEYHYLGYSALPGAQLRYFVKSNDQILALLGFGAAAWKTAPRDRYIGWDAKTRQDRLHLIINNARFLILPWVQSKNLASRVLSLAQKRICADWKNRYNYSPVLLETFVEKQRFLGTCYKAANWNYLGDTQGRGKLDTHKQYKEPIKSVWVYPLSRNFRKVLLG